MRDVPGVGFWFYANEATRRRFQKGPFFYAGVNKSQRPPQNRLAVCANLIVLSCAFLFFSFKFLFYI